jgi:hypothetical protein
MNPTSTATRVRVATLNIWGTRGDWSRRRPMLRDGWPAWTPA